MDSRIFESIVQITRHRDLDSLDCGFVETLRRWVPVCAITIHRLYKEDQIDSIEEILHLDALAEDAVELTHGWSRESDATGTDPHLDECLHAGRTVKHTVEDGYNRLLVPIAADDRVMGVVVVQTDQDLSYLGEIIEGLTQIYANHVAVLYDSEHDTLTGLLNRRTFDNKLNRLLTDQRTLEAEIGPEANYPERQHGPNDHAWLAIADIDHFKRVNDTYGHVYGDEILLRISQMMRQSFRKVDLLFRVGGEEFVIILAPIEEERARIAFERFREVIESHDFPQIGTVTVSLGYARIKESDYPRQIFDLADKALYFAKETGRNKVCSYEALVADGCLIEEDQSGSIELF